DFSWSEDAIAIRDGIRKLCSQFGDEYWEARDRDHEFPWDFYNAIADGGWFGITVPTELGGGGLGILEASVLNQEIAASGAGMNGCSSVHIGLFGFDPILKHGSDSLKERFLPSFLDGSLHISFAVTEPDAGTDTSRISTFARKVDGGYLVSGKKVWITKAQESQRMLLLCRTTPRDQVQRPTDGMSVLFAPIDRDCVDIREIPKLGRHAVDTNELFIDDLFVADEDVVGTPDDGFSVILTGLNAERVLAANAALGIGRAALRRAVDYAKERVVFDRPIGQNQAVQHPIAEAQMRLDAAELMAQKAAWLFDQGLACGKEANTAKFLSAEAGFFAADVAVQTHGGYGYAREYHVERYFREARLLRIAPVSQEMVLNYVAGKVMGLPKSY
ncbi:MAG: acyl-CoA dehydrogenase family protein, partial [Acidimicrobiales bacterium]